MTNKTLPHKTLLVVEDSPLLRRLIVEEAIEKFTGQKVDFTVRGMERKLQFGDLTIHWCDTLDAARQTLKSNRFDGAIIDIGFPDDDEHSRLMGNRNGLKLVKELREGEYPENRGLPIAVTSVEHVFSKIRDFFPDCSENQKITRGFFKGRRAPGTENTNVFNSTGSSLRNMVYDTDSVAEEPVNWLANAMKQGKQGGELDIAASHNRSSTTQAIDNNGKNFTERTGWRGWFPSR